MKQKNLFEKDFFTHKRVDVKLITNEINYSENAGMSRNEYS